MQQKTPSSECNDREGMNAAIVINRIRSNSKYSLCLAQEVSGDSPVKEIISSGRVFRPVSCQMVKSGSIQIKL